MCSPLAIGLGALTTIASIKSQKIQKKMQEVQQERASKAEDNRFLSQIMSLRVKEKQENEAASQKLIAACSQANDPRCALFQVINSLPPSGILPDVALHIRNHTVNLIQLILIPPAPILPTHTQLHLILVIQKPPPHPSIFIRLYF